MVGSKKNSINDNLVLNNQECTNQITLQNPNIDIHIWHRKKRGKYKYLGKVKEKIIFQLRNDNNILVVDLFIEKNNLSIEINTEAPKYLYENFEGSHKFQKYKMNCFNLLNLKPVGNWCSGIMKGI